MAAARWRRRWRCSTAPIARRGSWLMSRAKAGARTSRCTLRPLMGCPVSWWTDPTDRCRRRRSRLRATSFGRCTWCAIRTSCGIWRRLRCRTGAGRDEQVRQAMLARGLPEDAPDRLLGYLADHVQTPGPSSETVEQILQRPGLTFAEWATEHAAEFRH